MTARVAWVYHFNDGDWLGGRNYFASLFSAIASQPTDDMRFVFVTGMKTVTSLPEQFPWLEVVRTSLVDRMRPAWLARQFTLRLWDTDPLLARFLRRRHIDVLTHSGYLSRTSSIKTLPWLYDFQFMHLPEYWEDKHVRWAAQRYTASCRQGDAVIVSSADALGDLARFAPWCKVPRHVLHFVSNPVDFAKLHSRETIVAKYGLPDVYFHLPNQFWTNKNHRLVVDALALLEARGVKAVVACTGKTADGRQPDYFNALMRHCSECGVAENFRILGVVPYADAQALMAHSRTVINPSRFEGWSTTVEEAKTLQKRLLLSDIAVHREQSPELGRFFDVDDPNALAGLIETCLAEAELPIDEHAIAAAYANRLAAFGRTFLQLLRPFTSPATPR